MNDLYFAAKNKEAYKDEIIPASLNFWCKTYEKGQKSIILAIKNHNTDIFRINIMVSVLVRTTGDLNKRCHCIVIK